ncbi:dihydroorotase [Alcanivorax sp. JB21]|uniref:dihydroorotase n=1 Tax=Alcanivorax limicola TaxID=2874102 RepID=UPI001CBAFC86|nr:dihydroorotase [Alcanivorax limicola]MBZ2190162.1 dihydroorotase [Alcanivorax limicola]
MSADLSLVNVRVVNEGTITGTDVHIRDGRIAHIGPRAPAAGARVIEGAGRWLLPGMIDDQVHFREPGLTHKGDLATESAAAVAGGITSFMEMPNVRPATLTRTALEDKYQRAAGRSMANYAFYLGASHHNLDEIRRLAPGQACGVKVFMGASTGDLLVERQDVLEAIFSESPVLIATHCEDTPMIRANEARWRARFGDDIPMAEHPAIRSREACLASSSLAVSLARRHGAPLHVLHITTAEELALFEAGPMAAKQITAEACAHHLWFSSDDYPRLGSLIKCNPAIKLPTDREALVRAVNEDRIDIIATDHAPHTREEKAGHYFQAPAGLPLVQHALLSLLDAVQRGVYSVETVVRKTSHAVAERYGVIDRGYIREGCHADLVLVDPQAQTRVTPESLLYKCAWSPFEGEVLRSRIDMTLVNGVPVWEGGRVLPAAAGAPPGQRLGFDFRR